MNNILKYIGIGLVGIGFALWAQSPVRLVDGQATGIILGAPGRPYNSGMVTSVTTGTTITNVTTKVKTLFCRNVSGGTVTFTITDSGGTVYFPSNATGLGAGEVFLMSGNDTGLTMAGVVVTPNANGALGCQVEGAQ
jgi:hypothetical protein